MNLFPNEFAAFSDSDLSKLLGRPLGPELPVGSMAGRSIAITGAAGSIGVALSSRILEFGPASLVLIDHDETAMFYLERRLTPIRSRTHLQCIVEDCSDREAMHSVFRRNRVEVVIHAAAYKHLALMESNPSSALKNNVFTLLSLLEAAEQAGVQQFLLISSDKAVNPTSVMGCSKRLGELILNSRLSSKLRGFSVRFGNVLGSQGSVLPLWLDQLQKRQPLTVTDAEVTRFFMTLPEAVGLLLQSLQIGSPGDTLVLDVAPAVRVLAIAETLRQLKGVSEVGSPIVFTGLRSGEKLHEELFYEAEQRHPSSQDNIVIARSETMPWHELSPLLLALEEISLASSRDDLRYAMAAIVPEYQFEPSRKPLAPGE